MLGNIPTDMYSLNAQVVALDKSFAEVPGSAGANNGKVNGTQGLHIV